MLLFSFEELFESVKLRRGSKTGGPEKSDKFWSGRTSQNTVVVFPKQNFSPGDFVDVRIENCTSATLIGDAIRISKDI